MLERAFNTKASRRRLLYKKRLFGSEMVFLSLNKMIWYYDNNHVYTAISRKVVRKNVHATIPKGNMGYDRYTVPDDCSCRTCSSLALTNSFPWSFVPIISNFSEEQ